MKDIRCIFGKHDLKLERTYVDGDKWKSTVKCIRCGYIAAEEDITWSTTRRFKSREDVQD